MTVASGQIPYQYSWPTPFRVRNNSDQGLSGVHIEAAQFVIQAEMRKFNVIESATQAWRVYTNTSITGSGYDPKPNGETLNSLVGPIVQVDLDHIALMRGLLVDFVFNDAYVDAFSDYTSEDILEDWIRQTYPDSPSGYAGSNGFRGQFLRPILQNDGVEYFPSVFGQDPVLGPFVDSDPHWLGGSGVILDIDVGEVMWNPYPIAVTLRNGNTHATAGGSDSSWAIQIVPFYPSFQKTNGSLITLNGFENKWPEAPPANPLVLGYLPVGSGKVRFNAYPILGDTEFFFGRMNDTLGEVHQIGFSTDKMTVAAISETLFATSNKAIPGSEVFLNPISLASGVYRVACKNARVNYPFTTVESGVISQWPKPRGVATDSNYFGYEVFDSCFWVCDTRGPASLGGRPSGLSVVSPYTGKILWQRNATNDIAANLFISGTGVIRKPIRWWQGRVSTEDGFKSLERYGTDNIKRLAGRDDPIVAGVSMSVEVSTYNDLLTTVSSQSFDLSLRVTSNGNSLGDTDVVGMTFDGTDYWITGFASIELGNSASFVWQLDSSFNEIQRIFNDQIGENIACISDGKGGAKKLVEYHDNSNNNNINEWEVVVDGGVDEGFSVSVVASKAIDWTTQTEIPTATTCVVMALLDVSGVTELKDGVYAYVRTNTSHLLIIRIEEETTTWSIKGLWTVATGVPVSLDVKNHCLIVMPVN